MLVQNQYKWMCVFLWKVFSRYGEVRRGELSDVAAILSRIRFPISDEGFSTVFWATTNHHTHQCFDTFSASNRYDLREWLNI